MSSDVAIVDYGVGNLYSIVRAFEHCGGRVAVSADPNVLQAAHRLVLPGVGAFGDAMRTLSELGLATLVRDFATGGRPMLGICLGMQLLASVSDEFGQHAGLDLIPGRVEAIPSLTTTGRRQKIPHVGWARLIPASLRSDWSDTILADVSPGAAVYMVHSFVFHPTDPNARLADCVYGGHKITAAVSWRNISGTQFHPEKSGEVGLSIIRSFLRT